MSFQNDYNKMYNLTAGFIQNMYTNIFTSVLEMDFKCDFMLYTNLVQYEQYLFEWCIHLLKFSIYYITFLILFEFVSKTLENVNVYSSVTRKYIQKYNLSQEEIETLYFEIEEQFNQILTLKKQNEESELEIKRSENFLKETLDKNTQSDQIPSGPVKKKIVRKAAKKATKTIKELVKNKAIV